MRRVNKMQICGVGPIFQKLYIFVDDLRKSRSGYFLSRGGISWHAFTAVELDRRC